MSFISVDLPDPETPVITLSLFNGNVTVIFLRLCSEASITVSDLPSYSFLLSVFIFFSPDKYCPVRDFGSFIISSIVPLEIICPPFSPAPGPKSTI